MPSIQTGRDVSPMTDSEKPAVGSVPRREWPVVANDLEQENDRGRRTLLLQELLDSIWFSRNDG